MSVQKITLRSIQSGTPDKIIGFNSMGNPVEKTHNRLESIIIPVAGSDPKEWYLAQLNATPELAFTPTTDPDI